MRSILIAGIIGLLSTTMYAQENSVQAGAGKRVNIDVKYLGSWVPSSDDTKLLPAVGHLSGNNKSVDDEWLMEYKKGLTDQKRAAGAQQSSNKKTRSGPIEPVKVSGFNALSNQGTPSDNSVAINKNGQIVAVVNSSIRVYNSAGTTLGSASLANFFSNPQNGTLLTNNTCDPVAYYDAHYNRFIVFAQTCSGAPSQSQILVAFSQSTDAMTGWHYYQFTGNPSSVAGNNWFDYPKIGVSNKDFFATGNLFTPTGGGSNSYVESVIYQIDKVKCYSGQTLVSGDAVLWYQLSSSPFTLVPVSDGREGGYGDNMYVVSSSPNGNPSYSIALYEITAGVHNNPNILDKYVGVPGYYPPADGVQKGTSTIDLNTGDSRGQDAFYNNGIIHFVFHCSGPGQYTAINYSRLYQDGGNWLADNKLISTPNVENAFPSIASMGYTDQDNSALISYDYSSLNDYPGIRCVYVNHDGFVSQPVELKTGTGYVSLLVQQNRTRWGDYSGISREHNATMPTVWTHGMSGNTANGWTNYVSQVRTQAWVTGTTDVETKDEQVKIYPNPVDNTWFIQFQAEKIGVLSAYLLDVTGKRVQNMLNTTVRKGENMFTFDKSSLTPGNYFVRLALDGKVIKNEKLVIRE